MGRAGGRHRRRLSAAEQQDAGDRVRAASGGAEGHADRRRRPCLRRAARACGRAASRPSADRARASSARARKRHLPRRGGGVSSQRARRAGACRPGDRHQPVDGALPLRRLWRGGRVHHGCAARQRAANARAAAHGGERRAARGRLAGAAQGLRRAGGGARKAHGIAVVPDHRGRPHPQSRDRGGARCRHPPTRPRRAHRAGGRGVRHRARGAPCGRRFVRAGVAVRRLRDGVRGRDRAWPAGDRHHGGRYPRDRAGGRRRAGAARRRGCACARAAAARLPTWRQSAELFAYAIEAAQ
jgi:hypothetical protein